MDTTPRPFAGLQPNRDVEVAGWLVDRLHPLGADVGAVVPEGFPAYVRIDHPVADGPDQPHEGGLVAGDAEALAALLGGFTGTPDDCRFCLWDGYADVTGAVIVHLVAGDVGNSRRARRRLRKEERRLQEELAERTRAVASVVDHCGRVVAPDREYLLFRGPVVAVTAASTAGAGMGPAGPGAGPASDALAPLDGPNLWWPADRAWVVASEIDLAWTYVAGPTALADALLADPRFAASRTTPTDPIVPG